MLVTFNATSPFSLISIFIAKCLYVFCASFPGDWLSLKRCGWHRNVLFLGFSICEVFASVELFSLPVQPRWLSQLVLTAQLLSYFLQTNGCCCCRKCNHPSLCQRLFPWEDLPDTQRLFPPLSDLVYTLKRSVRHGRHSSCFQQKKLLLTHVTLNWNMSHPRRNAGLLKISYQ